MAVTVLKMGWVRDTPDPRDHRYSAPLAQLQTLPARIDLAPKFVDPPFNQGQIGSCTANAVAGAIQFARHASNLPHYVPSRLFIYYNERKAEHTVPLDAGAQIRTGIKSVKAIGACPEAAWPYDDTPADPGTNLFPPGSKPATKPSSEAYALAAEFKITGYSRVPQALSQMKACLAGGFPFTVGFLVFDSLYDAQGHPKKVVPLPSANEAPIGGHAVLAVGYDDSTQLFKLRNSWGPTVQEGGYFYLPYAFLTDPNLADDFWTVRVTS